MVLSYLPVPGYPNLDKSRTVPTALAVGAGRVFWTFFYRCL